MCCLLSATGPWLLGLNDAKHITCLLCSLCIYENMLTDWSLLKVFHLFSGKDPCKSVEHGCEHVCMNNNDSFICRCHEGFILEENGKTCRSKPPTLYSTLLFFFSRCPLIFTRNECSMQSAIKSEVMENVFGIYGVC